MRDQQLITINVAGDFYASAKAIDFANRNGYDTVFNDILPILLSKDLSLVNIESPLTNVLCPIRKSGPNLSSAPQAVEILKHGGFDVACLANNHILDQGTTGLNKTIQLCKKNKISYVGAGSNLNEARKILYVDLQGRRIAIMNTTENEFSIAGEEHSGANPLDIIETFRDITEAKKSADYLLLIFHGGLEHYHLPTPNMVKNMRFFIECGVDAIVCNHSHYPTGYEIYKGKPIFYGIGNFFFDLPAPTKKWNQGYLVSLKINIEKLITQFDITPFNQNNGSFGLSARKGDEYQLFIEEIYQLSSIITDAKELALCWNRYLKERSLGIASSLFPFIPLKRNILRRGHLPKLVLQKAIGMMNTFRCESLQELYQDGLFEFIKEKE